MGTQRPKTSRRHLSSAATPAPPATEPPLPADISEVLRIDVGNGIYVRVPQPASGPAAAEAARPGPAWRLKPAAVGVGAALAAVALLRLGVNGHGLLAAGVLAVLVVLASIDLQARVLPNRIVYPATALVLAWQLAFFPERAPEWLLAGLGAGLFFLIPAFIRPGSIGMGDVKLAVLLGAALGRDVLTALTVGCLALLPVAIWLVVRGRGVRDTTVPFGPFLTFGAAVVLLA